MGAIFGGIMAGFLVLFMMGMMVFLLYIVLDLITDLRFGKWVNSLFEKGSKKVRRRKGLSPAFEAGYRDMGNALYGNVSRSIYGPDYTFVGQGPWIDPDRLRKISMKTTIVNNFDPQDGRTSEKYMTGDSKLWEDYYQGGMKLLADVDDEQARLIEVKRVLEMRRRGVKELDDQYVSAKKELMKLRNKTFENISDREKFDLEMRKAELND